MLFEDARATCAHCHENIFVPIDPGGGHRQSFYIDCEVCCRSLAVSVSWNDNSQDFDVEVTAGD